MNRWFVAVVVLISAPVYAQTCLDEAIDSIKYVDTRGDFIAVQCDAGQEHGLQYTTSCADGGAEDFLRTEVLLDEIDGVLTCRVSIDGSGGDCSAVSSTEYYYQHRRDFNASKKAIRELCGELPWTLARIYVTGDDGYELYVNGNLVGGDNHWFVAEKWNVYLNEGVNVIGIKGLNNANGTHPGAVIADISIGQDRLGTDSSWEMSTDCNEGWQDIDGELANGRPAIEYGGVYSTMWWYRYYGDTWLLDEAEFPLDSAAQWIWSEELRWDPVVCFRKEIVVE